MLLKACAYREKGIMNLPRPRINKCSVLPSLVTQGIFVQRAYPKTVYTHSRYKPAIYKDNGLSFDAFSEVYGAEKWQG